MFRNIKLGTKILSGFLFIMLLLLIVAYAGYSGLTDVKNRVQKADSTDLLVKTLFQARLQEKDYIQNQAESHASQLDSLVRDVTLQAESAKAQFQKQSNKERMDRFILQAGNYKDAFANYVALNKERETLMNVMGEESQDALKRIEEIRADQYKELSAIKKKSDELVTNSQGLADDATKIIQLVTEARFKEKEFVIKGDTTAILDVQGRVDKIKKIADAMRERFEREEDKDQTRIMAAQTSGYLQAFGRYAGYYSDAVGLEQSMEKQAQNLQDAALQIWENQKKAFNLMEKNLNSTIIDKREKLEKADAADRIIRWVLEARLSEKSYLAKGDDRFLDDVDNRIDQIIPEAEKLKAGFKKKENIRLADTIIESAVSYKESFTQVGRIFADRQAAEDAMFGAAKTLEKNATAIRKAQKEALVTVSQEADKSLDQHMAMAETANNLYKWFMEARASEKDFIMSGGDPKWMEENNNKIEQIRQKGEELKSLFQDEENAKMMDEALLAVNDYASAFAQYADLMARQVEAKNAMLSTANGAVEASQEASAEQKNQMTSQIRSSNRFTLIMTGGAILLGVLLSIWLTRMITRPVNRIIEGLSETSDQVNSASVQVADASQSLAEGASEQAASIEETSSSMEEMAAMTQQNADHANQAKRMMEEVEKIVRTVNDHMEDMTGAVSEINRSSEETSKIIKTIDEIAFQTNLLALNAAVEAARAGEAGAGFAVVADEVRSLAMRAGDAARNTTQLIDNTLQAVKKGSDLTQATQEAFKQNVEITGKVGNLIQEIAAASNEQTEGIGQVTNAVGQMDKIVQQNAANAEESASAAEQMKGQSNQLKKFVGDLVALVRGGAHRDSSDEDESDDASYGESRRPQYFEEFETAGQEPAHRPKQISPTDVFPLDEEEEKSFKNF